MLFGIYKYPQVQAIPSSERAVDSTSRGNKGRILLPACVFPIPGFVVQGGRILEKGSAGQFALVAFFCCGMMDSGLRWSGISGLVVLLFVCGAMAADDTSCISELASCSSYLNSTAKPDKSCCDPLISVIEKDPQCLCRLLTSGTVKQLGVNVTRAMELPAQCGKNASASQCTKTSAGSAPAEGSSSSKSPSGGSPSGSNHTETGGASGRSPVETTQAIAFALAAAALQMFTGGL